MRKGSLQVRNIIAKNKGKRFSQDNSIDTTKIK